jgi:Zn finger protein HypA/HybF involved in hydrogenase expression
LVVNAVPIVVHCAACGRDSEIDGVQSFRCPNCGELAADLRHGRELEIESIEIEEPEASPEDVLVESEEKQ